MGDLAKWGAVAGASQGWQDNLAADAEAAMSQIDADRATALERLKQTGAMDRQTASDEAAQTRTETTARSNQYIAEINVEGRGDVRDDQDDATMERQRAEQEWRSAEAELNREHEERVAQITRSNSRSDPAFNALVNRFEKSTLTAGDTLPGTNIPVEVDTPVTYDAQSGRWYQHEGNRLILPGDAGERMATNPVTGEESVRQPNAAAIEALYGDPSKEDAFLEYFGFLPGGFLEAKRLYGLQQYVGGASTQTPTE